MGVDIFPAYDSLTNFVSNLGTDKDKASYSFLSRILLTREMLTVVYRHGGIGGKIVDCVTEDAGRKWRTVTAPDVDLTPFFDLEEELDVNGAFVEAGRWARLYGGAVILVEIDGDDPAEPLVIDSVNPNKPVSRLLVRDRHDVTVDRLDLRTAEAGSYVDITDNQVWDRSRVLGPFVGIPLPRAELARDNGWSASIFDRVYRALLAEETVAAQIASLLHEAVVEHVGVRNLSAYLDGGERQRQFERRYQIWKQLKSSQNISLFDLDSEELITAGTAGALGNLAPLLEKHANRIASIVDIPMTRLYGQLASGLTTSAPTNADDYDEMVAGWQKSRWSRHLRYSDTLLCHSVYGRMPEGFYSEWVSLREPSEAEKASTLKTFSEAAAGLIRDGVVLPGHVAEYLASTSPMNIEREYVEYLLERDGASGGPPRMPPAGPPEETE